jgi:hypothetical protein
MGLNLDKATPEGDGAPGLKPHGVGTGSATKIEMVGDHSAIDSNGVDTPYSPQPRAEDTDMPIAPLIPSKPVDSATEDMIALKGRIEQRLLLNPDYKALIALNKAIAEALGDEVADMPDAQKARKPIAISSAEISDLTQTDAVHVLLTKVLHAPAQTTTLVKALSAHGITVGGAKPEVNLSSVLSKDGRFRSVRYNGRYCWWIKGTPFPGEIEAG